MRYVYSSTKVVVSVLWFHSGGVLPAFSNKSWRQRAETAPLAVRRVAPSQQVVFRRVYSYFSVYSDSCPTRLLPIAFYCGRRQIACSLDLGMYCILLCSRDCLPKCGHLFFGDCRFCQCDIIRQVSTFLVVRS